MEQFLYHLVLRDDLFDPANWTEFENNLVTEHFNRLKQGVEEGYVILAGKTTNEDKSGFGIVIFEAENENAAKLYVNGDPAVKAGIMTATLFPYRVALIKKY